MRGQIVVGSINLDMVVVSPRIPGPGENVCGWDFSMVPGGKGANQAVASHRLGNDTFYLGCVGADYFGEFLTRRLGEAGVDTSLLRRTSEKLSGVALIVVESETGINTIVVDNGANMKLRPEDLDALDPHYERADSALFQLEIPVETVKEGARRARERGLTTVLDAGPPGRADSSVVADFDVVSPNQDELADLTGLPVADVEQAADAAQALIEAGAGSTVVKMGETGSLVVTGDGAWHIPAFKVKAVDATAAGDAFTAALATALGEKMDLVEAARFANAAGAAAVTVLGAQPSMPTREQVERIMAASSIKEVAVW